MKNKFLEIIIALIVMLFSGLGLFYTTSAEEHIEAYTEVNLKDNSEVNSETNTELITEAITEESTELQTEMLTEPEIEAHTEMVEELETEQQTDITEEQEKYVYITYYVLDEYVYLTSELSGFDDCSEIRYQWMADVGNGYEPVMGANDRSYTYHIDEYSNNIKWKLVVSFR